MCMEIKTVYMFGDMCFYTFDQVLAMKELYEGYIGAFGAKYSKSTLPTPYSVYAFSLVSYPKLKNIIYDFTVDYG